MSLDDQYSVIAKVLDASGNTQEFGVEAGLQGQILTCDYNFPNVFTFKDANAAINITDTNTNATYYPTFVAGSGSQPLLADITTTAISLNPSTGDFNVVDTLKLTQTSVALGKNAGNNTQSTNAVAIGNVAGHISQGASSVAIGLNAGNSGQGGQSVAVGRQSGQTTQGTNAVAVGYLAGQTTQGAGSVAIGVNAGSSGQLGSAVAVGLQSGQTTQGANSVAVGTNAGNSVQGGSAVAVGNGAGQTSQGTNAVAIGVNAGQGTTTGQGANAIAIGLNAGVASQTAGSICLNASGSALNPSVAGCFIDPIRLDDDLPVQPVCYNNTTKELFYASSAKFVYLSSTPAGYANKIYSNGSVVFGGLVAPFLSVKSTAGLTNSGTNGWVRTATSGAEGRFYSPTTTQWYIACFVAPIFTASYTSSITAKIFNSVGVLQSERYVSGNAPNSIDAVSFIAEMNAGDYLQFEASVGSGIQLQYENELYTSLQIRELL